MFPGLKFRIPRKCLVIGLGSLIAVSSPLAAKPVTVDALNDGCMWLVIDNTGVAPKSALSRQSEINYCAGFIDAITQKNCPNDTIPAWAVAGALTETSLPKNNAYDFIVKLIAQAPFNCTAPTTGN